MPGLVSLLTDKTKMLGGSSGCPATGTSFLPSMTLRRLASFERPHGGRQRARTGGLAFGRGVQCLALSVTMVYRKLGQRHYYFKLTFFFFFKLDFWEVVLEGVAELPRDVVGMFPSCEWNAFFPNKLFSECRNHLKWNFLNFPRAFCLGFVFWCRI